MRRRRFAAALFFIAALASSYAPQSSAPPLKPIVTEEGQAVVFDRISWQLRELAKRVDPAEAWPRGEALTTALARHGLDKDTPGRAIPVPARIATDVFLVGQDRVANLTYMIDCGSEGVAIIDPTYESEFERTVANVEKCGRTRKEIRWVINTHCHIDHAMADKKFREAGAEILVPALDADHVERGTRVTAYYLVAAQTGNAPFPKCKVDRRLVDGEELQLGNKTLHVIDTPGHTPGSASFLLQADGKNLLFSGDTVLYDARLGWQGNPYADNPRYLASLQKLETFVLSRDRLRWDMLLPGHGCISMDKAWLDVLKARQTVAADLAAAREIQAVPYATPEYRQRMYGRPVSR
jgi:glyoxylase-like metal-dependent hydrolase (beta-lactamase superfamily II)